MKTNDDKILRYLSELMTEDERREFEKEISVPSLLKDEFDSANRLLTDFKIPEENIDERYFASLLPKVRMKLDKLAEPSFLKKVYYLVPTFAAAIVGLMFLFKPVYNFDYHYQQLASQVVNNLSDKEVSQKYLDDSDTDPITIDPSDNDNDLSSLVPTSVELNDEIASKYLNSSVVEDYSTIHGLSDNELQHIADNLNSIKVK